jgi:PAS domain S-box-containing protein
MSGVRGRYRVGIAARCFLIFIIALPLPCLEHALSEEKPLLFLGNQNLAPVVFSRNGEPTGLAVDIVRALEEPIGHPIRIVAMDWAKAQEMVARGDADALIQINRTPRREAIYDFSDPLLLSQFSIFTTTDKEGITGSWSLRGLRVGVENGGFPFNVLKEDASIQLVLIPSFLEGFSMLKEGSVDAVVVDYRVGAYVLAENRIRDIRISGEPVAHLQSAIAVRKGNTELLSAINRGLRTIRDNGTYSRILSKWEPKDVIFLTREQILRRIQETAMGGLGLLLALGAIWIVTLKRGQRRLRLAEKRLAEQYLTLHGIVDSTDALIFSVDGRYRYTSFNAKHAQMMKALYGEDITVGRCVLDYMTVPEDRETAKGSLDQALAGEHPVREVYSGEELRARRCFLVSHSPIKAPDGGTVGVAVFANDITERKRAEEELQRLNRELAALNAELERRVADRTAELEARNRDLEKMNRLFIGRELRIAELKEKINALASRAPEEKPQ